MRIWAWPVCFALCAWLATSAAQAGPQAPETSPPENPGADVDDDVDGADPLSWRSSAKTGAQSDTPPIELQRQRVGAQRGVGGRPLVQPQRGESAFVTSHFGFRQGVAYLRIPGVPISEVEKRVDLELAGLAERFDLAIRFAERFGFFAAVEGQVVTSLTAETALVSGARTGFGWEFGTRHTLLRDTENGLALALVLRLTGADRALLSPSRLLDALRDEPDQTLGSWCFSGHLRIDRGARS
jgi:hypothetical protein